MATTDQRDRRVTRASLERIYVQWLCSHYQIEFITRSIVMPDGTICARKKHMSARDSRNVLSILERWHMSMQMDAKKSTEKMQSELVENGLAIDDSHAQMIVSQIANVRERVDAQYSDVSCIIPSVMIKARFDHRAREECRMAHDKGIVRFACFSREYSSERLIMMAKLAASYMKLQNPDGAYTCGETNDVCVTECITTAALSYDALVPRGQQLSIPPRAYDIMIQRYGATFEGFASPFNSQMMRYMTPPSAQQQAIYSYCSIFPRIDAPFGSVGSFFDEEIPANTLSNRVSVLNPPFIEKMLIAMVKKCITDLMRATKPTRIFIIVPNWSDSRYFTMLTTCAYIEHQLALPRKHYYVDTMRENAPIPMQTSKFLFVLSRNCNDMREHMYEDIIEAFRYDDNDDD